MGRGTSDRPSRQREVGGWTLTARLAGGVGAEAWLEGFAGDMRVAEVLVRAAAALEVADGAEAALRAGSRELRGDDTLAEAGLPREGGVVEVWAGLEGGMPSCFGFGGQQQQTIDELRARLSEAVSRAEADELLLAEAKAELESLRRSINAGAPSPGAIVAAGGATCPAQPTSVALAMDRSEEEKRRRTDVEQSLGEAKGRLEAERRTREQGEAEWRAQVGAQLQLQAEAQWKEEIRQCAVREAEWKTKCEDLAVQLQQRAETVERWLQQELQQEMALQLTRQQSSPREPEPSGARVWSELEQVPLMVPPAEYGGANLKALAWGMAKSVDGVDRAKEKAVEAQQGRLKELEAMLGSRLTPDASLGPQAGGVGGGRGGVLRFDAGLDDDEVLLRFFKEVDADNSGTISRAELMASPLLQRKENAQMAQVLRRAFGCDFEALAEALAHLDADDFGKYARTGDAQADPVGRTGFDQAASARAVFEATNPAVSVFEDGEVGPASPEEEGVRDRLVASRADVERLSEAVRLWPEGARKSRTLAEALEGLAKGLPAEGQLDFLALKAAMRRVPRVAGQRMVWVDELGLVASLARHLPPGTLDDG